VFLAAQFQIGTQHSGVPDVEITRACHQPDAPR
jgi:hypothetical protein